MGLVDVGERGGDACHGVLDALAASLRFGGGGDGFGARLGALGEYGQGDLNRLIPSMLAMCLVTEATSGLASPSAVRVIAPSGERRYAVPRRP
jgi:hypothetical protein